MGWGVGGMRIGGGGVAKGPNVDTPPPPNAGTPLTPNAETPPTPNAETPPAPNAGTPPPPNSDQNADTPASAPNVENLWLYRAWIPPACRFQYRKNWIRN